MISTNRQHSRHRWIAGRILAALLLVGTVVHVLQYFGSFEELFKDDLVDEAIQMETFNYHGKHERLSNTKIPSVVSQNKKTKKKKKNKEEYLSPLNRLGVVTYISDDVKELFTFKSMLYGSWRYNTLHKAKIFSRKETVTMNIIDIVAVFHHSMTTDMPPDCQNYPINYNDVHTNNARNRGDIKTNYIKYGGDKHANRHTKNIAEREGISAENQFGPTCWRISQQHDQDIPYKKMYSIFLFRQKIIYNVLKSYDYLFFTTTNTFLSPSLFTMNVTHIDIGVGMRQNCDDFNKRRLQYISRKLKMTHQDVNCLGDSVFGRTQSVIDLMNDAWNLSQYIYHNEFQNALPDLDHIDFKKKPDGIHPQWYRPDSLRYSIEIALNHRLQNFTYDNIHRFDTSSCQESPISSQLSVKCYSVNCLFNQEKFLATIGDFQTALAKRREELRRKFKGYLNMTVKNIKSFKVSQYATFIAWYSAGKYVKVVTRQLNPTISQNSTKEENGGTVAQP